MNYIIIPLTEHYLQSALQLRDKLFTGLSKVEYATLEASVSDQSNVKKRLGIDELYYWIALNDETVVGLVGLYTQSNDFKNQVWLGWYGVDNNCRRLGLGGALLDFAIKEAYTLGFETLKLYTTNTYEYAMARKLYEQKGFVDITLSKKAKKRYFTIAI